MKFRESWYILMEIERKYLVDTLPANLNNYEVSQIEQGYLSYNPEVRLRVKDSYFLLTIKIGEGLIRFEKNISISEVEYKSLLQYIKSNLILKKRYVIPLSGGLCAELDIYLRQLAGLITVEVEFETEEQSGAFVKPEWFGLEITDDKRYKNKNLSQIEIWNKSE